MLASGVVIGSVGAAPVTLSVVAGRLAWVAFARGCRCTTAFVTRGALAGAGRVGFCDDARFGFAGAARFGLREAARFGLRGAARFGFGAAARFGFGAVTRLGAAVRFAFATRSATAARALAGA